MATLLGMHPDEWRLGSGVLSLDFPAFAIICALSLLLAR